MDGIFTGAVAVTVGSASGLVFGVFAPDIIGWLFAAIVALVVWVYLDHRTKAKHDTKQVADDLAEHEKSDGEKFAKLFERVERIPAIEAKLDMLVDRTRGN